MTDVTEFIYGGESGSSLMYILAAEGGRSGDDPESPKRIKTRKREKRRKKGLNVTLWLNTTL